MTKSSFGTGQLAADAAAAWGAFEQRQGRVGYPSEIGAAVALLSSPKMSLVNGQNLNVDG